MGGSVTVNDGGYATEYTDIDQNTAATTTVYAPDTDADVSRVRVDNPGSTAELRLEVTDGTNTAVLADPAAGDPIDTTDLYLGSGDELQVVVEVVEGAAQTATAAVSRRET